MGNIKTMDNIPKLRFREFNDEWKNIELKNILSYEQPTKYLIDMVD